jgi:hypothetical protein
MKHIIDSNGYYIGFGGIKTELQEGQSIVPSAPPIHFVRAKWDGELWIEGATPEEILEARPVPEQVPLWALKATLDLENKLGAVEAALDQLPEIVKKKAYWIWEYGNFIQRSSQTVGFIGQVLGMNKTEIDTLFINSENIEL